MIVIVKSGPDTVEGRRALKLARDMAADIVLLQNGVYYAQKERLGGFCGTAHLLDEDRRLRGIGEEELDTGVRKIDYDGLIDLMAEDKVVGMF